MPAPPYIGTISSDEKNNRRFISPPHYTFFKDWGIPLLAYTTMHGDGEVSITHAVVEL
jgi:hypothetical protein